MNYLGYERTSVVHGSECADILFYKTGSFIECRGRRLAVDDSSPIVNGLK